MSGTQSKLPTGWVMRKTLSMHASNQSTWQYAAAMKSVRARWLVQMYEYISSNPQIIINGFQKAGIPQATDPFMQELSENSF